jgi:plasmid stabilization system protein ParE
MQTLAHPEAEQEVEAAAAWYEERQPGLGEDFLDDFERTLRRIVADPERWRMFHGCNRKLNFDRFPYAIVYSLQPEILFVKAVMHLHRRPFYWSHRQPSR